MPVDFPNSPTVDDTFDANEVRYQWDGVKWVARGHADPASDPWLPKAGGAMTGSLYLAFDPTLPLEAATKQYVDANAGGGVPPAPQDTSTYGVNDGGWSNVLDAGTF